MAKKQKKNVAMLIVLVVVLIILAALIVSLLTKTTEEVDVGEYPASTLVHEKSAETNYKEAEYLGKKMGCPSLSYDISVPDNIQLIKDDYFVDSYNGICIVVAESSAPLEDVILTRAATAGAVYLDDPDASWDAKVKDEGYTNGFSAQYVAGDVVLTGKFNVYNKYGVAYRIQVEGNLSIVISAFSDSKGDLQSCKNILDDMILTIVSNEEIESTETSEDSEEQTEESVENPAWGNSEISSEKENVPVSESTEESEQGDLKSGYWKHVPDGFDMFVKEYELYVEESIENMFLVFEWNQVYCTEMTVTGPDGKEYAPDDELSLRDTRNVFIIPEGEAGVYTIHYECTSELTGVRYEALTEAGYNAIYNGVDENGNPWLTMPGD